MAFKQGLVFFGGALFLLFDPFDVCVIDNEEIPDEAVQLKDQAIRVKDPDVFQTKGCDSDYVAVQQRSHRLREMEGSGLSVFYARADDPRS